MTGGPLASFALDGRIAVVTGAASGIGQGIAKLLAEAGATVVAVDVNEAGMADTVAAITTDGGTADVRCTDVADRAAVEALGDFVIDRFGAIHIWVNAAGILVHKAIVDVEPQDMERILAVNLAGLYWCCAAAARRMQPLGGCSIVNLSSTGADAPVPGLSLYSMTKAAVNMITRTAAAEWGGQGVRVNAVAPGFVDTPMVRYRIRDADGRIDPAAHEALLRNRAKGAPLGISATPRDIALTVLYLASDASRIVTGQVVRVNAGVSMA